MMPTSGILIKIDTEGAELDVLLGAERIMKTKRPTVIFEENSSDANRINIYNFFQRANYIICKLPHRIGQSRELSKKDFLSSRHTNFISIPAKL